MIRIYCVLTCVLTLSLSAAETLKVHGIFRNHMVLQREKPIAIWGWAPDGSTVDVSFGEARQSTKATGDNGRWEVTYPAESANSEGRTLTVSAGDQTVAMSNIVIGDVWVMNGQSNMAFGLKAVYHAGFESVQAHLPLLRHVKIRAGAETEHVIDDLNEDFINGPELDDNDWRPVTPEIALEMGAIGYVFGSRVQRALQIPIGIIDNARGGASIESLVPRHKFADHPHAKEYLAWVDARNAEFSEEDFRAEQMKKWEEHKASYDKAVAADKAKGVIKKRRLKPKPDGSIRTWSVPGRSPSDAAACYNGMFGVFKGINIKGVAFHQGFNNSMMNTSCKPAFYRVLMKLMVDGWREDFNNPQLPVAVIGLCAGGAAQTVANFEEQGLSTGAYIRESQRLGLADVADTTNTVFIPAYDQKIPQLHTKKKKELGLRTARWALETIYGFDQIKLDDPIEPPSVEAADGKITLTFSMPVRPDDFSEVIEGFSIAGDDEVFYMADAVYVEEKDKNERYKQLTVSSPLVAAPKYVRYAWSRAPMGNLKVHGMPWQPLFSFRTDTTPWPAEISHMDPEGKAKNSAVIKELKEKAAQALATRLEKQ